MPLRCLLFSSHEELVEPIWQVLADLGIEGEHCRSAVDAVEKVTTQGFQIVITDWDDQPEAAFLLKTARDLKATQRPLTLAIVSEDARPEALRAGANSVLVKPIRPEQVRDTMSTACQLLQAKQQPAAQPAALATMQRLAPAAGTMAAAAAMAPAQTPVSPPRTESDREFEVEPAEQAAVPGDDAQAPETPAAALNTSSQEDSKPKEVLTGWAMLQARLNSPVFGTGKAPLTNSDLLSYGEMQSQGTRRLASSREDVEPLAMAEPKPDDKSEATLFAYMTRREDERFAPRQITQPGNSKILVFAALVVIGVILALVPRTQQGLLALYRNTVSAGNRWLNPPPPPLPQAAPQHDSFGQSGDEYKLPAVGNIPDATTDPSQIQVLPVVDPTAKPEKNTEAVSGQAQNSLPFDSNNPTDQNQTTLAQPQVEPVTSEIKDPLASAGIGTQNSAAGQNSTTGMTDPFLPQKPAPPAQLISPQIPIAPPVRISTPTHTASAAGGAGIPSSLRSQLASTTPASSGAKPLEAAMSSIEPVSLPESAARQLLSQLVDPEYPAAAKASGQRGSVVLQVLIGRDGMVQDAKFLQGSFVFARTAIDAVKQWHFKPYSMNGRPVSVQSTITLTFQPPA